MLIRNKSSYRSRSGYVVSRKGCASTATERVVEKEGAGMLLQWLARGLLRWYAFVGTATRSGVLFEGCWRNRWVYPGETRHRKAGREEGKEAQAESVTKHRKKYHHRIGVRELQARGWTWRKKAKLKWVKVERDREFGRDRVFLDAVCANVTAFKVEYIARMYSRCTRSGLRLTCVTYSRKLYSNRGTFCARKCGYKLQLYGRRKLHGIRDCNLWEKCMKIKKYNNKL